MSKYDLKITGLTDLKKTFQDYKKAVKGAVSGFDGKEIVFPVPNLGITLAIPNLSNVKDPIKALEKQIKSAHKKAVRLMADEFGRALDEAMESPVWDWKGETRDIVDTGELKRSRKIVVDSDGDIHVFYGTDYAAIVHYGGYFYPYGNENAKTFYPGRPWVTSLITGDGPVEKFDFGRVYSLFLIGELMDVMS